MANKIVFDAQFSDYVFGLGSCSNLDTERDTFGICLYVENMVHTIIMNRSVGVVGAWPFYRLYF